MLDQFSVVPDQLRDISDHVQHLSDQIERMTSSLMAQLDAAGAVGGGADPMSDRFHNGPNGHQDRLAEHHKSVDAITSVLKPCSSELRYRADAFEWSDRGSLDV